MEQGNSSRIIKCISTIALSTSLTACYQSIWETDYSSDIDASRNYSITSEIDLDGNLVVGGASTVEISTDDQCNEIVHLQPLLQKYSADGELLWTFDYDNGQRRSTIVTPSSYYSAHYAGGPEIRHIAVDNQNNLYAAGMVPGVLYSTDSDDYDIAVFKLNSLGEVL